MTQNTKTDYYGSQWQARAYLQEPIVTLAFTVLKINGQLQQPFIRFLAWATSQIVSQGKTALAEKILTQVYWLQSSKKNFTIGSDKSKQQNPSSDKILFPAKAAEMILDVLEAIEHVKSIPELHCLVEQGVSQIREAYSCEVLDKNHQTEEGISIASAFLLNQVGLKTIQMVLPYHQPSFIKLMKKFYLDDQHPMDLQKLFRDPVRSPKVGCVISNLMKINEKACLLTKHFAFLPSPFFNTFLAAYVKRVVRSMDIEKKNANLLGIQTVELDIFQLRKRQESYYSFSGISKELIAKQLQFSTPSERKGIYLFPQNEIPSQMGNADFLQTEQEVFLKVLDANHRIVVISKTGFQSLQKLQLKMSQHLFQLMQKLTALFPDHLVTGRVKSARSFLDKCGRLCEKTQLEETPRCVAVTDIIDGCGCRITCSSSSQIFDVIQTLKAHGFEFLELDNKYNTIRKDGAYKVIPCAMQDSTTGLIFELQITTLTSTAVSDLFHNVVYKRNAIGLNPTEEEVGIVRSIQRLGALSETVSLVAKEPIVLTENLKGEAFLWTLGLLREMVENVIHSQSENAKL